MKAEAVHQKLMTEKNELEEALAKGSSYMREVEGKVKKVENEKREIDRQVSHFPWKTIETDVIIPVWNWTTMFAL